jgi:hypothetical protein
VGWKFLNFTGWATITTEGDPPYGTMLGIRVNDLKDSDDGHWQGDVTIVIAGDVTGAWFGER